jgi:hypothetical protein
MGGLKVAGECMVREAQLDLWRLVREDQLDSIELPIDPSGAPRMR